eukprot:CAMPEP_0203755946 /NCGR_PEP_ID=MMETSP0098-20131031/9283_1 /ASSEMBLY_ACC=CAM_ASM_000208 /TAXON_ID=96639 /ORGANISM=" , Strain NY0313808BC1" /LENGTH=717 /DNA_ID=CAMNT_0050647593 /DNA_START=248 /DNA_END=2398 /DNA_ORIENTATION=-
MDDWTRARRLALQGSQQQDAPSLPRRTNVLKSRTPSNAACMSPVSAIQLPSSRTAAGRLPTTLPKETTGAGFAASYKASNHSEQVDASQDPSKRKERLDDEQDASIAVAEIVHVHESVYDTPRTVGETENMDNSNTKAIHKPRKAPSIPVAAIATTDLDVVTPENSPKPPHSPISQTRYDGVGGTVTADSVGANVRVVWKKKEYARLHFAAIHVPWSCVTRLRDVAEVNCTKSEMMVVDIAKLCREEENEENVILFQENFDSVFGRIFTRYFIPLLHEKFNGKGTVSTEYFPDDIEDGFVLLVLAERLGAVLKEDIYTHLQNILNASQREDNALGNNSFKLINTSIAFSSPPPRETYQAIITSEAIESLINAIPTSLKALEVLVENCCFRSRPDLAAELFRRSTLYSLAISEKSSRKNLEDAKSYFSALEERLNVKEREQSQLSLFASLMTGASETIKTSYENSLQNQSEAVVGAGFKQGMVLHKVGMGASGGTRVVRCLNEFIEWKKVGKREALKSIPRTSIVAISAVESDSTKRTFRISSSKDGLITFRADSEAIRDQCVQSLQRWWSPDRNHQEKRHDLHSYNMERLNQVQQTKPSDEPRVQHHLPPAPPPQGFRSSTVQGVHEEEDHGNDSYEEDDDEGDDEGQEHRPVERNGQVSSIRSPPDLHSLLPPPPPVSTKTQHKRSEFSPFSKKFSFTSKLVSKTHFSSPKKKTQK